MQIARTGFPAGDMGIHGRAFRFGKGAATSLAGIRAGGGVPIAFPGALLRRAQWLCLMEPERTL